MFERFEGDGRVIVAHTTYEYLYKTAIPRVAISSNKTAIDRLYL